MNPCNLQAHRLKAYLAVRYERESYGFADDNSLVNLVHEDCCKSVKIVSSKFLGSEPRCRSIYRVFTVI